MSLLAELLSKAKGSLGGNKDVPPALKDLIHQKRERKLYSGRIVFLGLLTACSIAAGFWTVHYVQDRAVQTPGWDRAHHPETPDSVTALPKAPPPVSSARTGPQRNASALRPEDGTTGLAVAQEADRETETISARSSNSRTHAKEHPGQVARASLQVIPGPRPRDSRSAQDRRQDQHSESDHGKAASFIYSAMQFEEQMRYSDALEEYRKALRNMPESPFILNNISYLYLRLGIYANALKYAEKALRLDSTYVSALVNSGLSLAGLNRHEEAERLLEKAVVSEPHNRNALYNLGLLYEKEERFEKALAVYQDLVNSGDHAAYMHMARVYQLSGRKEDAIGVYWEIIRSTLVSDPVKKDAKSGLDRLTRILDE